VGNPIGCSNEVEAHQMGQRWRWQLAVGNHQWWRRLVVDGGGLSAGEVWGVRVVLMEVASRPKVAGDTRSTVRRPVNRRRTVRELIGAQWLASSRWLLRSSTTGHKDGPPQRGPG
jgi:hypothetical protein